MQIEVVMPKMGESIQEGKILRWTKKPGDKVQKDETILEISTDKVDSEIPSPAGGILTKIVVPENETVAVGTVIAMIETDAAAAKVDTSAPAAKQAGAPKEKEPARGSTALVAEPQVSAPALHPEPVPPRGGNGDRFYSPLVRTIAKKEGIALSELEALPGSGIRGRVTKTDLFAYLKTRTGRPAGAPAPADFTIRPVDMKEMVRKYPPPKYEVVQMDNVQQKMAGTWPAVCTRRRTSRRFPNVI